MAEIKNCLNQWNGERWNLYNGDSCDLIKSLPDDSIDFTVFSPPFANLYVYSSSENDMGNCSSHDEFFSHYEYLVPEIHRVTVPGRLCAVHCCEIPKMKQKDGVLGLYDFPGDIIRCHERHGWVLHSRVTIWKDPVVEMQRTKSIGLLHKQVCKDSSVSRQGISDSLLIFRKWEGIENGSQSNKPVVRPGAVIPDSDGVEKSRRYHDVRFESYVGSIPPGSQLQFTFENGYEVCRDPKGRELTRRVMSIEVWQRYASRVWFDISQSNVLPYRGARDEKDERHICPLQLDVIERSIHLWTNPGDVVLTTFGGVGSEGVGALRHGRKAILFELKESYCKQAVANLKKAEKDYEQDKMPLLFSEPEQSKDAEQSKPVESVF